MLIRCLPASTTFSEKNSLFLFSVFIVMLLCRGSKFASHIACVGTAACCTMNRHFDVVINMNVELLCLQFFPYAAD